jgi:4-diphosphocytidyl-2C-methyl-D-erythritol kinase
MVKDVEEIMILLRDFDLNFILMSGSGPTVFAFLDQPGRSDYIINNWPRANDFIVATRTLKKDFLSQERIE